MVGRRPPQWGLLLLLLLGLASGAASQSSLAVRVLTGVTAEVSHNTQVTSIQSSIDGILQFGNHSSVLVDLRALSSGTGMEVQLSSQEPGLFALWSEEGHFPRLLLNALSLTSLELKTGDTGDTVVVRRIPSSLRSLSITTGDGRDSITVATPITSQTSLALISETVDIREALEGACPIDITGSDVTIGGPVSCGGADDIVITATNSVLVEGSLLTDSGDIRIVANDTALAPFGISVSGATLSTVSGTIDLDGAGLASGIIFTTDASLQSQGGDVRLRGQGERFGVAFMGASIALQGAGLMQVVGTGTHSTSNLCSGVSFDDFSIDTSSYSVLWTAFTSDSITPSAALCTAAEFKNGSITASGVWDLDATNVCNTAAENMGLLFTAVEANFYIGNFTVNAAMKAFDQFSGSAMAFEQCSGYLPATSLRTLAFGYGLTSMRMESCFLEFYDDVNIVAIAIPSGGSEINAALVISESFVSVPSSRLGVLTNVPLAGEFVGVNVTNSDVSAFFLDLEGYGRSDGPGRSSVGIIVSGSHLTAQTMALYGQVAASADDYGVWICLDSVLEADFVEVQGQANGLDSARTYGIRLDDSELHCHDNSEIRGVSQSNEEGIGVYVRNVTGFSGSVLDSRVRVTGVSEATHASAIGLFVSSLTWNAVDTYDHSVEFIGFFLDQLFEGTCARFEGASVFTGLTGIYGQGGVTRLSSVGTGIYTPRGSRITSLSQLAFVLRGDSGVLSTATPELCVGTFIEGTVTVDGLLLVDGYGPTAMVLTGDLSGYEVDILVDAIANSNGIDEREGLVTSDSSSITATFLVRLVSYSDTGAPYRVSGSLSGELIYADGSGPISLERASVFDGRIVGNTVDLLAQGAQALEVAGDIIASTVTLAGFSGPTSDVGESFAVFLSGSIICDGEVSIYGSVWADSPNTFTFGVFLANSFVLGQRSNTADQVRILGQVTYGQGPGVLHRGFIGGNRFVDLASTSLDSAGPALVLAPSSVISTVDGSVSITSFANGLADTAILCRGVIDSNNAVVVNGTMNGPGAAAVTFSGAQFPGMGTVFPNGIAQTENCGGILLEGPIHFGGNVAMAGIASCSFAEGSSVGVDVSANITSEGTSFLLSGSGRSSCPLQAGIRFHDDASIFVPVGVCSVSAAALAGGAAALEITGTTESPVSIDCKSFFITADGSLDQTGLLLDHSLYLTSSEEGHVSANGLNGIDIRATLGFTGTGEVEVSSFGGDTAVILEDGGEILADVPELNVSALGEADDWLIGTDVAFTSSGPLLEVFGSVSGDSLTIDASNSAVEFAGSVSLSVLDVRSESVTFLESVTVANATMCCDLILSPGVVTFEEWRQQCGAISSGGLPGLISFVGDTLHLSSDATMEGPSAFEINCLGDLTLNGTIGAKTPPFALSFTASENISLLDMCTSDGGVTIVGGTLHSMDLTLDCARGNVSIEADTWTAGEFAVSAPMGEVSLISHSGFGATASIDASRANLSLHSFSDSIDVYGATELRFHLSSDSVGGLSIHDQVRLYPFGDAIGCLMIGSFTMSESSAIIIDASEPVGQCPFESVMATDFIQLQNEPIVEFSYMVDSIERGEAYVFLNAPTTTGQFANAPTTVGDYAVRVMYDSLVALLPGSAVSLVVNSLPFAEDDSYSTVVGETLVVAAPGVLANDNDPDFGSSLSMVLLTPPDMGTLTAFSDGSFTWAPGDMEGATSFTYVASDGQESSNVATVFLTAFLAPTPSATRQPSRTSSRSPSTSSSLSSSRTPSRSPSQTANFTPTVLPTVSVSASASMLVSNALVGPTQSPFPSPSPVGSSSASRSQSKGQSSESGEYQSYTHEPTTVVTEIDGGTPIVPVRDPHSGEEIVTVDIFDPVNGVLVVTVNPSYDYDSDLVSEVVDITFISDGEEVTDFPGGIEICFPETNDNACLAFFNTDTGEWECEDFCMVVRDSGVVEKQCGMTTHLTNFALLLDNDAFSDDKCGSSSENFAIVYVSIAAVVVFCVAVFVGFAVVELSVRRRARERIASRRSIALRVEALQSP